MHECDIFQDVALDKKCRKMLCVVTTVAPIQDSCVLLLCLIVWFGLIAIISILFCKVRVSPFNGYHVSALQVDKLETSESVRKEEEQATETQPIVYGNCLLLPLRSIAL